MLARKVFVASAILSGGRLVARFVDVIAALVIARFLSPADFGIVALATATLKLLRAATELPVSEALIRTQEASRQHLDTAFTLSLLRGIAVTALLCATAWPMAAIYGDERLINLMLVLSIAPFVMSLASPRLVRFSREVNYTPATIIEICSKLAAFALAVAIAYWYRSYWALVAAFVAPPLLSAPMSYMFAPYRPRLSLSCAREIFSFAGWLTLSRFVTTVSDGTDRYAIGGILGAAQLGFFSMGRTVAATVSWSIGAPLMQAMFPGFSRIRNDPDRLSAAYLRAQAMVVACVMPLGFGLALLAEPIVELLLGPQWRPVVPIVQIVAPVTAVLSTMTMPIHAVMLALGQPKQLLIRSTVMFVVGVPAVIAGAYWFGLMGAVYARAATSVLHFWLSLEIVKRGLGLPMIRQLGNCLRSAFAVASMVAVMLLIESDLSVGGGLWPGVTRLALFTAMGGFVYAAVHAGLWLLSGKPDGPEQFLSDQARAARRKAQGRP